MSFEVGRVKWTERLFVSLDLDFLFPGATSNIARIAAMCPCSSNMAIVCGAVACCTCVLLQVLPEPRLWSRPCSISRALELQSSRSELYAGGKVNSETTIDGDVGTCAFWSRDYLSIHVST